MTGSRYLIETDHEWHDNGCGCAKSNKNNGPLNKSASVATRPHVTPLYYNNMFTPGAEMMNI